MSFPDVVLKLLTGVVSQGVSSMPLIGGATSPTAAVAALSNPTAQRMVRNRVTDRVTRALPLSSSQALDTASRLTRQFAAYRGPPLTEAEIMGV